MAGFGDFGEAEGAHHIAQSDGGHVLGDVGHPDAHGGIDGEVFDAGEGLAVFEGGKRGVLESEDIGSDEVFGAGREQPLAVGSRHE